MIEKNKYYTIKIDDMGKNGEGIGKINGFAVFVENTLPQDIVNIKIVKVNKSYAYGKLIDIIEPSPHRIKPECEKAERCGGCTLQHLEYRAELRQKEKIVRDAFERIGGFKDIQTCMRNIIGMENPVHYRNKAQFPVCRNSANGEIQIGFFSKRSHTVVDVSSCPVLHKSNEEIICIFRDFMEQNNIEPYHEASHTGLVRHIFTRVGFSTGEIMVCIIINGESLPHAQKLIDKMREINGMASISLCINTKKTNVILGKKIISLWGRDYIYDYIGGIKFRISPLSFYQVNPIQTEALYKCALNMAETMQSTEGKHDVVCIDAYCGIGTISLYFAQYAKKIFGIEIVPEAVSDAYENAKLNGISSNNVEFITGKSEEEIPKLINEGQIVPDLIVVDPPRKGCDVKLLEAIAQAKIKNAIYISCDPATLARDVRYLCDRGYKIRQIRPVDMFPRTIHVETVVLMSKVNPK